MKFFNKRSFAKIGAIALTVAGLYAGAQNLPHSKEVGGAIAAIGAGVGAYINTVKPETKTKASKKK